MWPILLSHSTEILHFVGVLLIFFFYLLGVIFWDGRGRVVDLAEKNVLLTIFTDFLIFRIVVIIKNLFLVLIVCQQIKTRMCVSIDYRFTIEGLGCSMTSWTYQVSPYS